MAKRNLFQRIGEWFKDRKTGHGGRGGGPVSGDGTPALTEVKKTAWIMVRTNDYEALYDAVERAGPVGRLLEKWSEDDGLCDIYPGIFRVRGIVFANEVKEQSNVHH